MTGYSETMTGASGVGAPTTSSTVAMGGLLLVVILVAIAVSVVLQILDVAIVRGGADATGSFRVAWNVTTTVPVSVVAGAVSITVAITYHVAFFDRVDADYDLAVAAEPSE